MVAQKAQSKLMKKYGTALNSAVVKHREDETDFGFQRLPGGIENGIARLRKCYFKEYDANTNQKKADGSSAKGEYYFRAEGTVVEPTHNNAGVPVFGLITSIMIPVCDTKKKDNKTNKDVIVTQEDRVEEILNEMRKLGGDEYTRGCDGNDLEALAEGLTTKKPCFRFRTELGKTQLDPTTGKPKIDPKTGEPYTPRVWENWYGAKGLENYTPPDETDAAVEESASAESNGAAEETTTAEEPAAETEGTENTSEVDAEALTTLAEAADVEDTSEECKEAKKQLKKLGLAEGIAAKKIGGAENWATVVEMILEARAENAAGSAPEETTEEETTEEETTTEAEDDGSAKYVVGENFKYAPKVDGKPGKKKVDVEITATDPAKRLATIKNLIDNRTVYKNVPWGNLIDLE